MPLEKTKVVIWGASGHALVVADIIRLRQEYKIAGFLDNVYPERRGEFFCGATVLGGTEALLHLRDQGISCLCLAVGNCLARLELADIALEHGFSLISALHPTAVVAGGSRIGSGSVLCAGSVVGSEAELGTAVLVNTCASVDHECVVGDGVNIGPGAHLAAKITVGRATSIGIGSAVRDRVNIGSKCVVGAGSVVVSDLRDGTLAYGVPARERGRVEQAETAT